jgi:hypothetical protein
MKAARSRRIPGGRRWASTRRIAKLHTTQAAAMPSPISQLCSTVERRSLLEPAFRTEGLVTIRVKPWIDKCRHVTFTSVPAFMAAAAV